MFYAWEKYEVSQDNRPAKLRMLTIDNTILQTGRLSLLARCLLCQLSRLGLTHEIAQGETHDRVIVWPAEFRPLFESNGYKVYDMQRCFDLRG